MRERERERERKRERERAVVKITNIYIAMVSPKHRWWYFRKW